MCFLLKMVVFHSRVIVDQRVGALKNWEVVVDEFQRENVLWKKSTNEVFVDVEHVPFRKEVTPLTSKTPYLSRNHALHLNSSICCKE